MTSQVLGSDFTDGALLPNYVNGRLLVAEDLATGQTSLRTRDTRVGEAAGAGVVRGLWVTATGATITVADGLGLSRAGEAIVVAKPTTLQLAFATAATASSKATFGCCGSDSAGGVGSTLGQGILLLTARAACKLDGSAPMAPSPGSDLSPCCAAQWLVAGVEFRAIALSVGTVVDGVTLTAGNRRNLVAHWLYGSERLAHLGADPFSFAPAYTGFDLLDPADLTAYDVPLAVFRWDGTAVADLDNWSARRRITEADPVTTSWSVTTADHRVSDGEARFLQFQDQAEELVARGVARSTRATDVFGLLPPVGFLPVDNGHLVAMAETSMTRYRLLATQTDQPIAKADVEKQVAARWAARLPEQAIHVADSLLLSHTATGPAQEQAYAGTADQLKAGLAYYQGLYQLGTESVGYGFDPRVFFGPLARFGGVLDWQLAEWALHQSWRAFPVRSQTATVIGKPSIVEEVSAAAEAAQPAALRLQPTYVARMRKVSEQPTTAREVSGLQHVDIGTAETGTAPGAAPTEVPGQLASRPPAVPITYYYVIENIEAAQDAGRTLRQQARSYLRAPKASYSPSNLYVVFIANRRWVDGTRPPFIDHELAGTQVSAGAAFLGGLPHET